MCSFSPSWEGAEAPRASYSRSRRLSSADQRGSPATSSCVWGSTFKSLPQTRAEACAVGVVEDLIRQRERDRVASPGRQLELIVDHVLAPKLLVALRSRRVVLPPVDADVKRGVCEAAHARAMQPHREAKLEEQAGRRLRDRELGLDRLRDGEIALPAELERLELDLDCVALHLA